MTRKSRRLGLIAAALCVLASASALALYALRDNIVLFYGPSEIAQKNIAPGARLSLGGLVKAGSLIKTNDKVNFIVTDNSTDIGVAYAGQLPDLFREGQGVVCNGVLEAAGKFRADTILAKHDENYMPREVVELLKKQGRWKESGGSP